MIASEHAATFSLLIERSLPSCRANWQTWTQALRKKVDRSEYWVAKLFGERPSRNFDPSVPLNSKSLQTNGSKITAYAGAADEDPQRLARSIKHAGLVSGVGSQGWNSEVANCRHSVRKAQPMHKHTVRCVPWQPGLCQSDCASAGDWLRVRLSERISAQSWRRSKGLTQACMQILGFA